MRNEKYINMEGKTFGHWEVKERAPNDLGGRLMWICRCVCGKEKTVYGHLLRSGGSTNCGCRKSKPSNTLRSYEASYNQFIHNVKNKHTVEISYEEFVGFTATHECTYCGGEILWVNYGISRQKRQRYNLDRKDNSLGYTKANCVVCCKRCNYIKGAVFTYAQMMEIGKLLRAWNFPGSTKGMPTYLNCVYCPSQSYLQTRSTIPTMIEYQCLLKHKFWIPKEKDVVSER